MGLKFKGIGRDGLEKSCRRSEADERPDGKTWGPPSGWKGDGKNSWIHVDFGKDLRRRSKHEEEKKRKARKRTCSSPKELPKIKAQNHKPVRGSQSKQSKT